MVFHQLHVVCLIGCFSSGTVFFFSNQVRCTMGPGMVVVVVFFVFLTNPLSYVLLSAHPDSFSNYDNVGFFRGFLGGGHCKLPSFV